MSRSSVASRLSSAASSIARFSERPFVAAVREALPWSFIGLIVAFAALLPFAREPGPFFNANLGLRVAGALVPAFSLMGATLAVVLGVRYALRMRANAVIVALCALASYLIVLPSPTGSLLAYLHYIGPSGLFIAIFDVGCIAFLTFAFRGSTSGAALATVGVALLLRMLHVDVPGVVLAAIAPMGTLGDTYVALLVIVFVQSALWAVGVHGPALLAAVVTPVYLTLQIENTRAFNAHVPLPHIVVVSLFLFVFPGGAGSSLPLAALFSVSRVARLRTLGRATIVPSLFNANEPLMFGAPVVFNPYLIPPFIVAPLLLATVTYAVVALGLVARPAFYVPSSIPTIFSTFLATLDWRAVVLAVVNIAIALCVYIPFVRAYERHLEAVA